MPFDEVVVGPEELAERIAMVRDSWTEAERAARRRGVFAVTDWRGFRDAVTRRHMAQTYRLLMERN